tara:strand:+ start:2602 stop:4536 length:1935 start_codon:yes stop_codon:yes gene_type:complete
MVKIYDVKQNNILDNKITPVYFFKQSYDGSYNLTKSYNKKPNMKINRIDPYIINKKINDTLSDASLNDNNYLSFPTNETRYSDTNNINDTGYNNFMFNYISLSKKDFNSKKLNGGSDNKIYNTLHNSIKKQLEYLTCMVSNDSFKIIDDNKLNNLNKKSKMSWDIISIFKNSNFKATSLNNVDNIRDKTLPENTFLENTILWVGLIITVFFIGIWIYNLITSKNIQLLSFIKYLNCFYKLKKNKIYLILIPIVIVIGIIITSIILNIKNPNFNIFNHFLKNPNEDIVSVSKNVTNTNDISGNLLTSQYFKYIFYGCIISLCVFFCISILLRNKIYMFIFSTGVFITIIGTVFSLVFTSNSKYKYIAVSDTTIDIKDNFNTKNISTCDNIKMNNFGFTNIRKVLLIFISYVISLVCFLQTYTLGKEFNKENMVNFKFLKNFKMGIFPIESYISNTNLFLNININDEKKKELNKNHTFFNVVTGFIGTFSPYLKLSSDISLFLLFPIPYFIIMMALRYITYIISTILFRKIKKIKSSSNTIPNLLSILFERPSKYFELASKYGDLGSKNKTSTNINKNIKNFNGTNDKMGFKYLPYGLPWMTVSTIIKKIIMLLYYLRIEKIKIKDSNKKDIKIKTSDIYYLSFMD